MEETREHSRTPAWRIAVAFAAAAVPGIHFALAALCAGLALWKPIAGISAAVAAAALSLLLSGPEGALVFLAVSGALVLVSSRGGGAAKAVACSTGPSVLLAAASLLAGPGMMALDRDLLEGIMPLYRAAGMPEAETSALVDTMVYLSPGIGAVQILLGCLASAWLLGLLRPQGAAGGSGGEFRLGLPTAWMLIGSLALLLFGGGTAQGPEAVRAGANILLFLCAPYSIVGLVVALQFGRGRPASGFLLATLLVLATPMTVGLLMLVGLMDTWLDLRARMRAAGRSGGG